MTDEEKIVEKITKQNLERQNQNLRLFIRFNTNIKLEVLEKQKSIFYTLKNDYIDVKNSILGLASLILAINFITLKIDNIDLNAIKFRSKNIKARAKKREKLLSYWAIIKNLKLKQKMSFREISKYLKKYYRLEVNHSTIYKLWNDLENISKKQEYKNERR